MAYQLSKQWGLVILFVLLFVLLWYILVNPNQEHFHDRGVGGDFFGGCGCHGLSAVAGYRNVHPLFIQSGDECSSCLTAESWCHTPEPEWADPPPLNYRVPKDVCYC